MIVSALLQQISGIEHGFGDAREPLPSLFSARKELLPRLQQVHGNTLQEALVPGADLGQGDGVVTSIPGLPVGIRTADCVPLLLARKDGKRVLALHAGWRGTLARILKKSWSTLAAQGEYAPNWVVAIGPAIGPCCYEVSSEIIDDFKREFSTVPRTLIEPAPRHLDLPSLHEAECQQIGFGEIEVLRSCTCCKKRQETPVFHSYRRDLGSDRQWAVIAILL